MVRKQHTINLVYPFVFALFGIFYSSIYIVPEGQRALVGYANQTIKSVSNTGLIKLPGLHFRIPFLSYVRLYEHRAQHLNIRSDQITTHDLNHMQMEVSIRYRILNPALYFAWMDKMDIQENPIGLYFSSQLNQYLKSTTLHIEKAALSQDEKRIQAFLSEISAALGIELTETYITQLRLSEITRDRFLERMKKTYEQRNAEHRIQGKISAAKIRAQALNQANEQVNTAQAQAAIIRSKADIFAIELYNKAYRKHPKFAQFYQNLSTYQRCLDTSSPALIVFQLDKLLHQTL